MAVSKSLRFDVFARDSFTCQYCGRRPPEVILELDHIHPQARGGGDDEVNLITSCCDCNRGKAAKVIAEVAPRPDADLAYLKTQQEIVEVTRFLRAKEERDRLNTLLCEALQEVWSKFLTAEDVPTERVLLPWIRKYGAEEISKSIEAASPAYMRGQFGFHNPFNKLLKYVGAIMRNRQEDGEAA